MPSGAWAITALRHALLADERGQRAGVDAAQRRRCRAPSARRRDASCARKLDGSVIGAWRTRRARRRRRHADGLDVLVVDADIADVREGEGDDLPGVGGIGEDLLVAGHGGVEADLADRVRRPRRGRSPRSPSRPPAPEARSGRAASTGRAFGLIGGHLIDRHVRSTPLALRSLRQNARTGGAAGCGKLFFRGLNSARKLWEGGLRRQPRDAASPGDLERSCARNS